jgi:hypothetical protein
MFFLKFKKTKGETYEGKNRTDSLPSGVFGCGGT